MSEKKSIIPTEQRTIPFYNDRVTAVLTEDGTVYVPVKSLCELIGVDWTAQYRRINRDAILAEMATSIAITATDVEEGSDRPKTSQMICLPLSHLNGWLFGISASRVKEAVKEPLLRYQRDCYTVLYEAFSTGIAIRPDNELMQSNDPIAVAFRNSLANARLARETYYLTQRVDDHERRLGLLEAQLSNTGAYVTQEQAQLISEGVKAVSGVLSDRSGKNEYGGTYVELYRRFGVTSYKHIPTIRFDECMNWLRDWWQTLTDETDLPF